jgi:hypothetical protein
MVKTRGAAWVALMACSIVLTEASPGYGSLSQVEIRKTLIHEHLLKCYLAKRMLPEATAEYEIILRYKPDDAARLDLDYANAVFILRRYGKQPLPYDGPIIRRFSKPPAPMLRQDRDDLI